MTTDQGWLDLFAQAFRRSGIWWGYVPQLQDRVVEGGLLDIANGRKQEFEVLYDVDEPLDRAGFFFWQASPLEKAIWGGLRLLKRRQIIASYEVNHESWGEGSGNRDRLGRYRVKVTFPAQ